MLAGKSTEIYMQNDNENSIDSIASQTLIYPQGFSLVGNSSGIIKNLGGFKKSHKLPDEINAATQNFVARIGADEVRETADVLFSKMRLGLGYKRRNISASEESGVYVILTPDFTLNISIEINPNSIAGYLIVTEVTNIENPDLIIAEEFASVFERCFDKVIIDFPCGISVEDIIDKIEDYEDQAAVSVDYPADASFCTVNFKGLSAMIRINSSSLNLTFVDTQPMQTIVEACRSMSCFFNPEVQ